MQIKADLVVGIDYTLTNGAGKVLDRSAEGEPLLYLHGHGNIVEGLEAALDGHVVGDELNVVVSPEQGYGLHDDELVFQVPREQLPPEIEPVVGLELDMESESGRRLPVRIRAVTPTHIEFDANHELAGETLHFAIKVVEVRRASGEELAHGHAHDPSGHHH